MSKKPPRDISMLRNPPKVGGLPFLLWNTRPEVPAKQWSAFAAKAAALQEAQAVIDGAGARGWLWIEDGDHIHISPEGEANAEWRLVLFESVFDALDAIAGLPDAEYMLHHEAIFARNAGKEPTARAVKGRKSPKAKPQHSKR